MSSILNVDTKTSAFLLRHRNNRRQITGTAPNWIANVLKDCGISMTLGNLYLLVAGNHWQLIQDMRYVCGIVKDVVSIEHPKVKRRARVTAVYLIK